MSQDDFRREFEYLVANEPPALNIDVS